MNIYLSNETNFERNGVGFLTDLISAKVTESLNGDYILGIEYPVDGILAEYLIEDNILKSNVGNDNYQLFRIKQVIKDFSTIKVYALHISYDLLNNMLLNVAPTQKSCALFGQWILDNTQIDNNFTFESDITNVKSARYVRKNPIEAIMGNDDNSMINLFGGELEKDNFKIKMLSNRGSNNGVKLIFGKNIKSIKITIDITSLYTRLIPIGFDGLMLPEIFVDSPIINDYYTPKISKVELENIKYSTDETDDTAYHNIEEAYQALRNACFNLYAQGVDKPTINIKIDWLELSKTKQYRTQYANLETVRLGDIITANVLGLDYTTKVTKTVYNVLTDSIDKFEIGTLQQTINNTINQTQKEVENVNVTSILKSATENATNLITSAMGGYVYKTQSELYIMDTDNPNTAQKVWRWNINGLGYSNTGINGKYGIAMTMDGSINADFITSGQINTSLIKGYDSLIIKVEDSIEGQNNKISQITQTVEELNSKIGDIADITTSLESNNGKLEFENINQSEPIRIVIRPNNESISYLYPSSGLYPSDTLYPKTRTLRFHNKTTDENFDLILPDDVLYHDSQNYDEFILDYDGLSCVINKKVGWNADGTTYVLDNPTTKEYEYPHLEITDGDYEISLLGYDNVYMFIRLMAQNIYTTQFATKAEVNSEISQTTQAINLSVDKKLSNYSTTTEMNAQIEISANNINQSVSQKVGKNEVVSSINNAVKNEQGIIELKSNSVIIDSDNFNLSADGTIRAKNGTFEGRITSTEGNVGGWDLDETGLSNGTYYIKKNGYSNIYTIADIYIVQLMITGTLSKPPEDTDAFRHYDINNDGVIDLKDFTLIQSMILGKI
jgi:phage minor structural protein